MARVFLYADETGNLDYKNAAVTESGYFGFGTATFGDEHGDALWIGLNLRASLSAKGLHLPRGFHAKDDSTPTKDAMFNAIHDIAPRFDATFLYKPNAYPSVEDKGQMYLYKLAWYLHFKETARRIANRNDTIVVVAGSFGTKQRQTQAREALAEVCDQIDRSIELCIWDASTSWGLQVADYGLWSTHRDLLGRGGRWHDQSVRPTLKTTFLPWGRRPT